MLKVCNLFAMLALVALAGCAMAASDAGSVANPGDGASPGDAGEYGTEVAVFPCAGVFPEQTIGDMPISGHIARNGSRYTTVDITKTCHGGGRTPNPNYRAPSSAPEVGKGVQKPSATGSPRPLTSPPVQGQTGPSADLTAPGAKEQVNNGESMSSDDCKAVIAQLAKVPGTGVQDLVRACQATIAAGPPTS